MKIGALTLKNKVIFAPMAGYSDMVARLLAVEEKCGLVFTEMVHVMGISHRDKKTLELMKIDDQERPVGIQLFGNVPEQFAAAVKIAEEFKPEIIDINMGCPARKVTSGGSGSALMKDLKKATEIIRLTVKAASVPVTLKLRLGWDADSINYLELATIAEQEGIAAITLHPRTRSQMFKGNAAWEHIKKLKETVGIPVIGNGDIKTAYDAKKMIEETNCDGVMIARAAIGNPWIFSQTISLLEKNSMPEPPPFETRAKIFLKHAKLLVALKGEKKGVREMRKFVPSYLYNKPGILKIRQVINKTEKLSDLESIVLTMLI